MNAGVAWRRVIAEQLVEERDRKKSLEQRGVGVITTSSVLVTLLLGLAAVARGADAALVFPPDARPLLGWALVAFVMAGLFAIGTNVPFWYQEPTNRALRGLVQPGAWQKSEETGAISAATLDITIIEGSRAVNTRKAWLLLLAMAAEVIAVGLLAGVVWIVLTQG